MLQNSPESDHSAVRTPISVVVLAKNEEANIVRCIQALNWAADVLVVDDRSTDRTAERAIASGARVMQHSFENFASQRNWAMDHGKIVHDWVFHLDADEVCTPELQREIHEALENVTNEVSAFRMCRKTMLHGHWLKYSDGFPVWIMRLVRHGSARFQDNGHGEIAVPVVDGTMSTLREPFLHFAFSKGLGNWIDRHNRYSTNEASLELSHVHGLRWRDLLSADKAVRRTSLRTFSRQMPFRPVLRFIYQFFLKGGFLDGRAGWTFCRLMAMYEGWIVLKRRELFRCQNLRHGEFQVQSDDFAAETVVESPQPLRNHSKHFDKTSTS